MIAWVMMLSSYRMMRAIRCGKANAGKQKAAFAGRLSSDGMFSR